MFASTLSPSPFNTHTTLTAVTLPPHWLIDNATTNRLPHCVHWNLLRIARDLDLPTSHFLCLFCANILDRFACCVYFLESSICLLSSCLHLFCCISCKYVWDCDMVNQFLFSLNNCGVLIQFVVIVFQLAAVVYRGLLWPFIQLFLALGVLFDLPCWLLVFWWGVFLCRGESESMNCFPWQKDSSV